MSQSTRSAVFPKVSVIIPAYNQAAFLGEALRSVLAQTLPDFEVIVVNDGSTDDTPAVMDGFSDHRVVYVSQENRGLPAARNSGIRQARGRYLAYLDSDDVSLPERLAGSLELLEQQPELGLVAGQSLAVDERGQSLDKLYAEPPPADPARWLLGNPLHVSSVIVRRDWQERAGYFDETLRSYEDWDMWLRLALLGCQMGWLARPVSLYRFHTQQMTRNSAQMTRATLAVLDKVFALESLPPEWLALKAQAYSSAFLRAAATFYLAGEFSQAKSYLEQATQQAPELLTQDGAPLALRFQALANSPKILQPLDYLETVYHNLPASLEKLRKRSRWHLGQAAVQSAFVLRRSGKQQQAAAMAWRAVRYWPGWLANRGVLSILFRSGWSERFTPIKRRPSSE